MQLISFFATAVFYASTVPACTDVDVQCFKLHLVDQALQIDKLTNDNVALTQRLSLTQIGEKTALDAASIANTYAQKIQQETQGHWYERPVLWFALGFVVASAACIGIAAAINHVTR